MGGSNAVDRDLEKAEEDAGQFFASGTHAPTAPTPATTKREVVQEEGIHRITTNSSSSSSTSSVSTARRNNAVAMSRQPTQSDQLSGLERNMTAMSRIHTQRTQHSVTVGRTLRSREPKRPLPEFGAGKPYPPQLPEQEEYVVEFDGEHDPLHGQNWPLKKKILTALMLGWTTMISAFTSSIYSAAVGVVSKQYNVSTEVGILGVSLYVLGFATGPMLWAPLSELRGRRLPIIISMFGFSIFEIGVATAPNLQTVMLCRFWAGFFSACPLAVVAAVFSDIFSNAQRGLALTAFSMTVFTGPLFAPFVGGFITESYLGWRWTQYIPAFMGFSAFILDFLFMSESYPPIILVSKAAELRRRTKNWGIHAKQEEIEVDFRELISNNFSRPLRLLFTEPIILLISIYMSFIYGLLYLFLTAYPIAFQQIRGMGLGVGGLPFLGMVVGQLLAGLFIVILQPSYNRKLKANNNVPVPEWRLPPVIVGGVAFAIGLFWFGWTGNDPNISFWAPTCSGLFTGFGLLAIFLQSLNYLVDAYLMFAASAIAGNTFLRSLAGAGFPLFAPYMFKALHLNWGGTLLGIVAILLVPIPVTFYIYGAKIRQRSKFAPTKPKFEE
ncbi:MAG: hypothetical protein M1814_001737 [Vezdaea aestivalis]|nr:MAG: hypothetical protein M1814_001737 [Vezdaea aestivalis]